MKLSQRDVAALFRVIEQLIQEVDSELYAAGDDEVRINPMLRGKRQKLDRAEKTLKRLRAKAATSGQEPKP